jgi:tetratricopeptide (TPR) repeat protein
MPAPLFSVGQGYNDRSPLKKKSPSKPARTAVATPDSPPLWPRLWPYLLLIVLAFGVYANALDNGFVSDDDFQLLGNPLVTDWHQLSQIFQHHIWAFAGQETTNYYRPIQMVLYMAMYYAFGFDAVAFHLGMVLIHVLDTLLVFHLGKRLLKSRDAALVAGIIFAVHPIHNEPVVWIAVLPDVLLTMVVLVTLVLFIRWDAAPRRGQIAAVAGLFFLALLTKEPGAMLVPLLAGYEFFYLGRGLTRGNKPRSIWDNWVLYASMMGAFGVYMLLRIHALHGFAPAQGFYYKMHGQTLVLSIISTLGQYLGMLFVPIHLNYFHFFEATTSVTPLVILCLAVELGAIAAIFLLRRRVPLISYALFFILIPLAPALNINGIGENVFTERYLYLPSVGFVLAVAMAWEWLATRQREVAWAAVGLIVAASAMILIPRNRDWHDDVRLFTVSAAGSPKSGTLVGNLGWFHYQKGEYDAAIEKYLMALKLQPEMPLFHNNIGNAYAQKGRHQDAAVELRKAIALKPDYAEAHMNLGLALEALGDIPGAVAEHKKALELKPNYAEALTALALLRMKDNPKDYPGAIDLFQRAIAANPRYTEAYINLGVAYNDTNRFAEGSVAFRKAIAVGPNHPSMYVAHYNLGVSYSHLNSPEAAAMEFSKSLQLRPNFDAGKDALKQAQEMIKQQPAKKDLLNGSAGRR